jgi:osmotically-inducible protein OsmY
MDRKRRDGAQRMIIQAAKLEEYQPTPASIRAFNDLALSSRVHATLFAAPNLRGLDLDLRAEDGHIYVSGKVAHGLEAKLLKIIKYIPGVTQVTSELYSAPPQGFLQL